MSAAAADGRPYTNRQGRGATFYAQ